MRMNLEPDKLHASIVENLKNDMHLVFRFLVWQQLYAHAIMLMQTGMDT